MIDIGYSIQSRTSRSEVRLIIHSITRCSEVRLYNTVKNWVIRSEAALHSQ